MKIFLITLILFSCDKIQPKNELVVPLKSEVSTLDPHKSYDLVSNLVVYQMYEPLYQYHYLKRPYTDSPLLAEDEPNISENGLTYTIKIKKQIPYHNQQKIFQSVRYVHPEDFVNSFKRIAYEPTESKGWWLIKDKIVGLDDFRANVKNLAQFKATKVEGIKVVGDDSFQIKLTKPFPQLIHFLSMAFVAPVPIEVIEKYENKFDEKLDFGTGPYTLVDFQSNSYVQFEKFPQYQTSTYPETGDRIANDKKLLADAKASLPLNEKLRFVVIQDDEERWKQFLDNKIDFIEIPANKIHSVLNFNGNLKDEFANKNIELNVSSSLIFWWFAFNMNDPIVGKNKNLRKAIAHAIDIDKFIVNFYNNTGRKANSIYPPGVVGYNPSKENNYSFNLKKAREYLAAAGYPEGKGLPVLEFNTRRDSEEHVRMAQFVKKDLAQIGIVVKVIINSFTDFLDKAKDAKMQMWQGGWLMDYPDPENVLQLLYSKNGNEGGPNKTRFNNPEFDKLYLRYLNERDKFKKEEILKQAENIIQDELPWILSNYSIHYIAYKKGLKNFRYSDLIFNLYKYLKK